MKTVKQIKEDYAMDTMLKIAGEMAKRDKERAKIVRTGMYRVKYEMAKKAAMPWRVIW